MIDPEVLTRQQFWGNFIPKEADASGTDVMPMAGPPGHKVDKKGKTMIPKIGSVTNPPEGVQMEGVKGEQPESNPQTAQLNPRVDVGGKEAPKTIKEKKASFYALPGMEKYPIDSYADVERAVDYFNKYGKVFAPIHRREYCFNLEKRASALGISTSPTIRKYGAASYAPQADLTAALDIRKNHIRDESQLATLQKLANSQPTISPDIFAEALSEFDKTAGLNYLYDSDVLDPYFSTYGVKEAEDNITHVIGNDIVSNDQLVNLSKTPCEGMHKMFGHDFHKEFKEDPIAIFKSLPTDQKKVVMRMAMDIIGSDIAQ